MSGSTWSFTLVTEANGVETTLPGTCDAPANATEGSLLNQLLNQLRNGPYRGVNFTVISFDANRLA